MLKMEERNGKLYVDGFELKGLQMVEINNPDDMYEISPELNKKWRVIERKSYKSRLLSGLKRILKKLLWKSKMRYWLFCRRS